MCGITFQYPTETIDPLLLTVLKHRGPDALEVHHSDDGSLCVFNRLAIIDNRHISTQPFFVDDTISLCNGEIYNWKDLIKEYNLKPKTTSDCEVIPLLYEKFDGVIQKVVQALDGEFAFILYDRELKRVHCARDPFGVRPLFYNYENSHLSISSEAKSFPNKVMQHVEPGECVTIYLHNKPYPLSLRQRYFRLPSLNKSRLTRLDVTNINLNLIKKLEDAVRKRIRYSDRPIGCFLSGGLDSSIVTALAYKYNKEIECFSIGLEGSRDVEAAKKVAQHLGIKHHIVSFTVDEGFAALNDVIRHLETYDTTTIRASIPQYLLCKYIKEKTDVRVLLSGEGADEVFAGYQYSKLAPSAELLDADGRRLLRELHLFDNLRTDRTTAAWGLEVRTPFLDKDLVEYVYGLPPDLKMIGPENPLEKNNIEKSLLRNCIQYCLSAILPKEVLWRPKDAFSDAVSSTEESWFKGLQKRIQSCSGFFAKADLKTEQTYYRHIFHRYFPKQPKLFSHYWEPKWTDQKDPSATTLECYE